jgi:hypothetical protein
MNHIMFFEKKKNQKVFAASDQMHVLAETSRFAVQAGPAHTRNSHAVVFMPRAWTPLNPEHPEHPEPSSTLHSPHPL